MSEFIFLTQSESTTTTETGDYTDVAWDYAADKPLYINGEPVIVVGLEAVKSWAYRALRTRRYGQVQHSWLYGNDLQELVGQMWLPETKIAEAKRYVEECLLQNPYINGISGFTAEFSEDTVHINFTLETEYGNEDISLDSIQK